MFADKPASSTQRFGDCTHQHVEQYMFFPSGYQWVIGRSVGQSKFGLSKQFHSNCQQPTTDGKYSVLATDGCQAIAASRPVRPEPSIRSPWSLLFSASSNKAFANTRFVSSGLTWGEKRDDGSFSLGKYQPEIALCSSLWMWFNWSETFKIILILYLRVSSSLFYLLIVFSILAA